MDLRERQPRTISTMTLLQAVPIARVNVMSNLRDYREWWSACKISSSRMPPGIGIFTSSPTCLPSRPRPIGEVVEIMPFAASASSLVTMLIGYFFIFVDIEHHDRGAEPDPVARDLGHIHHGEVGQPLHELAQPRIDEALPLLGGMILGVLPQVAVGAGLRISLGSSLRSSYSRAAISSCSFFLSSSIYGEHSPQPSIINASGSSGRCQVRGE